MKKSYKECIRLDDLSKYNFEVLNNGLNIYGIDLMSLIDQYGTPLKFTYLPKISANIQRAQYWFNKAIETLDYEGDYRYCYCTKSAQFKHVLDEVFNSQINIETSSSFDIDIVQYLIANQKITKDTYIICNGYKQDNYLSKIAHLINLGFTNCLPILDNTEELSKLLIHIKQPINVGIRLSTHESNDFKYNTSRLGIKGDQLINYYKECLQNNEQVSLTMFHFFINSGITDTKYYWRELERCLDIYVSLKQICPSLKDINIGGGLPIATNLKFDFDYESTIYKIVEMIQLACKKGLVEMPNIFTEFGRFTVGESSGVLYKVMGQKAQGKTEIWNMIDSSFITTLPDTWAINQRYIVLPINRWSEQAETVSLGGLTCDHEDYYEGKDPESGLILPIFDKKHPLYIGFFNTGAYQENISGYGGLQHCLIPSPKHIIIDKKEDGVLKFQLFKDEQSSAEVLDILGF